MNRRTARTARCITITPAGRGALRRVAGRTAAHGGRPRSAPLVQVFFAGQMSDAEILAKFEGFAAIMRALLAQYEQVPDTDRPAQNRAQLTARALLLDADPR